MSEADPQADVETPGPSPFAEQLRVSSPFAEQFRVPQFGIIHLLIWSTVTAVLLKYYLAIADESSFQESPVQLWLIRISQSLSAILVGSIVIGSGILIRARCYKMLRRLQPGHWLVLVVTFGALLNLIAWPIYRHFLRASSTSVWGYILGTTIAGSLTAAAYAVATVQLRDARRWKFFFAVKVLGEVATVILGLASLALSMLFHGRYSNLFFLSQGYWSIGAAAILVMLLVVTIMDVPIRASRDWLHWLGITVLVAGYAMSLAWQAYYTFFRTSL
ncbi:MAG: hypothetical protein WCB27_23605 [Thermoguttaceae bacterium]